MRILLNHFKWDKEKLMERYYSGDQEALFTEAKVVPPHRKIIHPPTRDSKSATCECEICLLTLPIGELSPILQLWYRKSTPRISRDNIFQILESESRIFVRG